MKNIVCFLGMGLIFFGFCSFESSGNASMTLQQQQPRYSNEQIKAFIREVYQDQADAMFFNPKSKRLEMVTDFLNRIEYVKGSKYIQKDIPLLSSIKLIDKYNSNLMRDGVFNPETFNPLKYNFTMGSKSKILVRVDASEYVIVIQPVP